MNFQTLANSSVSRETIQDELRHTKNAIDFELNSNTGDSFKPIEAEKFRFYPAVESAEWVDRLLKVGVKTVQLRIKDSQRENLEEEIEKAISLGREHGAQVFINDYWELAIKHGAYGVHLGQEDLIEASTSLIKSAGIRLGISTHSFDEILIAAKLKPSYIALGHIFPTTTKDMPSQPQGLARLRAYQKAVDHLSIRLGRDVPTVAIGGIDLSNAKEVLSCGVDSIAVVRAVTQANNVELAVSLFNDLITETRRRDDE
ncbi:thiamine phosphate synthase [Vibrio sp. HN007]|uniref:thiamine phosphate synthase n=1 Tax=Vibrio iocasae TaxID=3098914 RepID=UPI0035D45C1B